MGFKMIAAVSNNWGIGKDNKLLFSIPTDMKYFRRKTAGAVVIMGRKTLESFPGQKPLKNRRNIVLTRDKNYHTDAEVCHTKDEVLDSLKETDPDNIFVIGGSSIYELFEDLCDTAYITKVKRDAEADAYFMDLDKSPNWERESESEVMEDNGIEFSFCTYVKKGR